LAEGRERQAIAEKLAEARIAIDEWHLVLGKASRHIVFGLMSRFSQEAVMFRSSLSEPRLVPIGSVSDAMDGNGVQELLVKAFSLR
jgi:hypothetical protein